VRLEAPTGQPADAILEIAARRRSDLIVMGTHGLTGANRLLLGSTTLTVLQRTPIPVLAIPPFRRRRTAIPPTWPGERIVAALDFEDDPDRAVEIAARVAQWFGSALLLVHVIAETRTPAWAKVNPSTDERVREAHAQQQIARLAAAARRRVATEAVVVRGRVSDRIAALAATTRIGLTITALRDRRSWFGSTRGAVSYQVLSDAATPVLAYPPGWTAQLHRRAV
jgi:nucleotide-binding universal stress UspA family protein